MIYQIKKFLYRQFGLKFKNEVFILKKVRHFDTPGFEIKEEETVTQES